jgi:methyltransferase (TIGR00027 family)
MEGKLNMEPNQAGITALITAYARAYHATHDSPKIFDDFLADALFTKEEHVEFNKNLAGLAQMLDPSLAGTEPDPETALAAVVQIMNGPVTLGRSRFAEDALEQAYHAGVEQYVILGAGFDTFAFRHPDWLERLNVFEVDHPNTQAQKRQRIRNAGWEVPANLHFVPVDFSKESLSDGLKTTPYDPGKATFFSWLGVTFYLGKEDVLATLRSVAGLAPKGSPIVFDYFDAAAFVPGQATQTMRLMHDIVRQAGEPMKSSFDPLTLGEELKAVGFDLLENLGPEEIEARYFQGRRDRYHAHRSVHFARAVVA